MDVTTDKLNKIMREINLEIEEYELQHQERIRFIEKWVQEAERSWRGANSKSTTDSMKRTLPRLIAEESNNPPLRSSRSAAKAAATKIRNNFDLESDEGSSKKRRCVVKLERISAPLSVLDVIDEEQETDNKSLEMKHEVACATVYNKQLLDFHPANSTDNVGEFPSADKHSPLQPGAVVNSTFDLGVVQQGSAKCDLPHSSDKGSGDCEKSPADPVQYNSCSDTFVISAGHTDSSISGEAVEDKWLNAVSTMPEQHLKENKTKPSQAKLAVGMGLKENEEAYSDLQKLIIESPVRVTRTKTRAFAQAAAAAAAATTNERENFHEPVTKQFLPENVGSIKYSKKKLKTTNKKEVNGLSNIIMSPTFQKHSNKTTPEDSMKENYLSAEKSLKAMKETAVKDLSSAHRLKTPLSANNILSSNSFQNPKLGVGTVVSHCETFITKNTTKQAINQVNQKLLEESRHVEEKVTEAEKKKERLLKEKAEQQRRNNEARAAKVAKTREQLERQRVIQQQQQEREKEQRLRIAQQKREEEMALKRQLAHQRAAEAEERRKQEEEQYIQTMKKKEQEENERKAALLKKEAEEQTKSKEAEKNKKEIKAKYHASDKVAQPPNVFSTNDIYSGEESEDEEITVKKVFPLWTAANRARVQLSYQEVSASLVAQLFQFKPDTPDLIKIFGTVPDKALVRTSSAVWNSPPCNKTFN